MRVKKLLSVFLVLSMIFTFVLPINRERDTYASEELELSGDMTLSAGKYHTIAVKNDGRVLAWGDNTFGQIGDGTNTDRSKSLVTLDIEDVLMASAGKGHTVAVKTDGTVWTWGLNNYGQLGDGTTTNRNEPVKVTGLVDVIKVVAGKYHTVALTLDGKVYSWGLNAEGQLGSFGRYTPQGDDAFIIFEDGKQYMVEAFTTVGENTFTVPEGVTEVHALVIGGGGGGGNSRGGGGGAGGLIFRPNYDVTGRTSIDVKVGDGGRHVPGGNPGINGENSAFDTLVALGGGGGGAVSSSTNPDNYEGKDGGSGGGARRAHQSFETPGGSGLQPSQPGDSGSPYGFGHEGGTSSSGSDNQTGGGGAGSPGTEAPLGNVVGGRGLNEVEIYGVTYNFANIFGTNYGEIIDGEAWFAGGGAGQAGYVQEGGGGQGGSDSFPGKPNTGGGGGGSSTHLGTDGGTGIVLIRYEIDKASTPTLVDIDNVLDIDTGHSHVVALKADGKVWAWGVNELGQLGDGATRNCYTPIQVSDISGFVGVSAGANHTVALKEDGTIRAWGKNDRGQLGLQTVVEAFTTVGESTFTVPEGVSKVDVLVIGGGGGGGNSRGGGGGAGGLIFRPNYNVMGKNDITVIVGDGGKHVPGGNPGTNGENSVFDALVALGGGGGGAVSGSIDPEEYNGKDGGSGGGGRSSYESFYTLGGSGLQPHQPGDSGSPYGFGNQGAMNTGNSNTATGGGGAGTSGSEGLSIIGGRGLNEVEIYGVAYNFANIFGTNYGEIIDGEAWFAGGGAGAAWLESSAGANGHVQEGGGGSGSSPGKPNTGGGGGGGNTNNGTDGGSGIVLVRYQISKIDNLVDIDAGHSHTVGLKNDGTVWTWGGNEYGQLGDGTNIDSFEPVQIMDNVSSISAGFYHTAVVRNQREIWTWGRNNKGQLGDSTTIDKNIGEIRFSNANLSGLSTSIGTLSPAFDKETKEYRVNVANSVSRINLIPTTEDEYAIIDINGERVLSGDTSQTINLHVGTNIINIEITSQDTINTRKYTLAVRRQAPIDVSETLEPEEDMTEKDKLTNGENKYTDSEDGNEDLEHIEDKEEREFVDDRVITTTEVKEDVIIEKLNQNERKITISSSEKAENIVARLNVETVKRIQEKEGEIEVKNDIASYRIPAREIVRDEVIKQFEEDIELRNIEVDVSVKRADRQKVEKLENTSRAKGFEVLANPVEFKVSLSHGEKRVEINRFNRYIERRIAIPENVDINRNITGVVLEEDGTVRQVPTRIVEIDGKYYAEIRSITNSVYSIVSNSIEFKDAENHWARESLNDMGSRFIISGREGLIEPEREVTRVEFVGIVLRALGIRGERGNTSFEDILNIYDSGLGYIETAYKEGLVSGYEDGTFRGDRLITREEAMVIISRAMRITELEVEISGDDLKVLLNEYSDLGTISEWARSSVLQSIRLGIVVGRGNGRLEGNKNLTISEAATMVRRLLQKSDLM